MKQKHIGTLKETKHHIVTPWLLALAFFWVVCLCSASTVKNAALFLVPAITAATCFRFSTLRSRISPIVLALALYLTLAGISTQYALAPKFALYEFLKLLNGFCLALLLLAFAPKEKETAFPWIGTILAGFCFLSGLVSVDLISTRLISTAVTAMFGLFSPDYTGLEGLEAGVRITSIFGNPNVFAGVMGFGVLLSLQLAQTSTKKEQICHTFLLFGNALAFLLAFSMGASGTIAVGFLVFLVLQSKENRGVSLVWMVETFLLALASAAIISMVAFDHWDGFNLIPLALFFLGGLALYLIHRFVGYRIGIFFASRSKILAIAMIAIIALAGCFALLAYNTTGSMTFQAGESLRRSVYLESGEYALDATVQGPLSVTVESQNKQETMMHTSTILYKGDVAEATFTVPDGSMVVYCNFNSPDTNHVEQVTYTGAAQGEVPLKYTLLPGFISNRIQGLFANENAIQRLVFFDDGLKLAQRSPVFGLGLGSFENAIKSAQSFFYETKYAHNHYIQVLAELGIVGFISFLSILVLGFVSLWKGRKNTWMPCLAACLVFLCGHAMTEVVLSTYAYLPIALAVFAMIGLCPEPSQKPAMTKVKTYGLFVTLGLMLVFFVGLICNVQARSSVEHNVTEATLRNAISTDPFEKTDYMLSYVNAAMTQQVPDQMMAQAQIYADELAQMQSNSIPIVLAQFYFTTNQPEKAFAMLEQYVLYMASDSEAWNKAFQVLLQNWQNEPAYLDAAATLKADMEQWNQDNIGTIVLDEEASGWLGAIAS